MVEEVAEALRSRPKEQPFQVCREAWNGLVAVGFTNLSARITANQVLEHARKVAVPTRSEAPASGVSSESKSLSRAGVGREEVVDRPTKLRLHLAPTCAKSPDMVFADLKNDFVFRRIFADHPEILRGLLNDLLERTGDRVIESLEYLPSEQLPLIPGLKLSILDVRCKERGGGIFIVEMQLVHMAGFLNRMVYNGSKAYVSQLKAGESYTKLVDVVAIAICDFELWPDDEQDKLNEARMPMHSRFALVEQTTGNRKLLQIQYAFLELPKVPKEKPQSGAALWAWLFVNAPKLDQLPHDLPQGPARAALELAKEASFSQMELEAYRKVMDEIQQARDYGETKHAEGVVEGKSSALFTILGARGLTVDETTRERIARCKDPTLLDTWISRAMSAQSADEVFA